MLKPSEKALVPFVSVQNMMRLINHVGIETMIRGQRSDDRGNDPTKLIHTVNLLVVFVFVWYARQRRIRSA